MSSALKTAEVLPAN